MDEMPSTARKLYDSFLERQKDFRPEDRAAFIREFLKRYHRDCGGLLTSQGICPYCEALHKEASDE